MNIIVVSKTKTHVIIINGKNYYKTATELTFMATPEWNY